jgi:hypothetical protein
MRGISRVKMGTAKILVDTATIRNLSSGTLAVFVELAAGFTPVLSPDSTSPSAYLALNSFFVRYLHGDDLRLPASIWSRVG